jgi:hypothetical protein
MYILEMVLKHCNMPYSLIGMQDHFIQNLHSVLYVLLLFFVHLSIKHFRTIVFRVSYFQVLNFIRRYMGSANPLIAGNSVYTDLLFLKVREISV